MNKTTQIHNKLNSNTETTTNSTSTGTVKDTTSVINNIIRLNRRLDDPWSPEEHQQIINTLLNTGKKIIITRDEYTLFKEILYDKNSTEDSNLSKTIDASNTDKTRPGATSFNSPYGEPIQGNETTPPAESKSSGSKRFLAPLDIQKESSIAERVSSFKMIQSNSLRLNIGFDTEFQDYPDVKDADGRKTHADRIVLCLSMSVVIGDMIIRYFFLVNPDYQRVTAEGGRIPVKHCLTDIFDDLKHSYLPELPVVSRKKIKFKNKSWKGHDPFKVVDYRAMKDSIIPVTLVCHTAKADISVFRRSKYDVDLIRKVGEIQGGFMSTEAIKFRAETDNSYNNYYLVDLQIRDTMGLTPAEHKSLAALGNVINREKINLKDGYIEHMSAYAATDPIGFYEYAVNDADIVIDFCSELFRRNRALPMTLSSAAASAMYRSIKKYLKVRNRAAYDRKYRGLEELDEGLVLSKSDRLKFLKATRLAPIQDNPDAKFISDFFEQAYVGGYNTSYHIGWITDKTNDFDLKNAYPTAMALIRDIDWEMPVKDFPRDHELTLQDIPDPLMPVVAVGDFDFPDDCYCPNIPTPAKGGLNIYPLHGRNVYMTGVDMYLALKLGAKITIHRGFKCCELKFEDGTPSKCLSYAVANLVQDRATVKKMGEEFTLIEKALKTMVCSCYGKTAQNVSPKTRYNAKKMGRVDAEPSAVTSPYHAAYTTALVRCMLIACINRLHDRGYHIYSVTTDGFITDAPEDVLTGLNAYGFTDLFQEGRYTLNQTTDDIPDNHVWEIKHHNDILFNITTRGNVAVNEGGVLAHNSYTTGETKDSMADREAYIIAVLSREGKLKCPTNVWTKFADLVERKSDHHVSEIIRQLSMDFDYKRCPILETATDTPVHYESSDGKYTVDTVIAEFDTRPFNDVDEFLDYRPAKQTEDCIKVVSDLERVDVKASVKFRGYIGKDL